MANRAKKVNPVTGYFRATRAELRKVNWPTFQQGWSMTKIVLFVTIAMALFLGVLDFFFGWLLGGIIAGNALFILLGIVVSGALLGAAYLISQGKEA